MADKTALVTGASSGIGYSLAQELAVRGYDLLVCCGDERLERAAEDFRAYGVDCADFQADLATRGGIDKLWEWVQGSGLKIDIACLNAGMGVSGPFKDTELEAELSVVELNCTGTVQLAKHIVRDMAARREGRILFASSFYGDMGAPREAVIAATKAFLLSFARSLRDELEDCGVTVSTLQPGPAEPESFHGAYMEHTRIGTEGRDARDPDEVAKQGIDALMAGRDHVYAASTKAKIEGTLVNLIPERIKAALHEKHERKSRTRKPAKQD